MNFDKPRNPDQKRTPEQPAEKKESMEEKVKRLEEKEQKPDFEQVAQSGVTSYFSERLKKNQEAMENPDLIVQGGDYETTRCEAYIKQVKAGKFFDSFDLSATYDGQPTSGEQPSPYDFFKGLADPEYIEGYSEAFKDNPELVEKVKKQGEEARKLVESMEQLKPSEAVKDIKVGDVIDFGGKKVRVKGFTAPKGDPGRAFMVEDLKPEELESNKQREDIIMGKIKNQIESNPNATVDIEQAKKYWGRMYDEAGSGTKLDAQINEIYAQRYEKDAKSARERMMETEQLLNKAHDEAEKQALLAKIVEEREWAITCEQEAKHRRSYTDLEGTQKPISKEEVPRQFSEKESVPEKKSFGIFEKVKAEEMLRLAKEAISKGEIWGDMLEKIIVETVFDPELNETKLKEIEKKVLSTINYHDNGEKIDDQEKMVALEKAMKYFNELQKYRV